MRISQKLLVLCPYPVDVAPSQRFRIEQYLPILQGHCIEVTMAPFLSASTMRVLYKDGYYLQKFLGVAAGFVRRLRLILTFHQYQHILVHREATPIGPPIVEYLLFKFGKKVIYDFDDAIFIPKVSNANNFVLKLKCPWKVAYICKHAYWVCVSNLHLEGWAREQTHRVVVIPTPIELTDEYPTIRPSMRGRRIVIGWSGSHSTVRYLKLVEDVLAALSHNYDFEFIAICDVDPRLTSIKNYRFVPWRVSTSISDLAQIDIGLMPVPHGAWELGKLGFKSILYSAVAAVPIVSDTGSPHEIVIDGETGYVVENSPDSWTMAIQNLLENPGLISKMGAAARSRIAAHFSIEANAPAFLSLFDLPALSNGAKN